MNAHEVTKLCRAIATISPSQHFDDETPAIWTVILAEIRYQDAREAVVNLGRRQRYIAPVDIATEVSRIRTERLRNVRDADITADIPSEDTDTYQLTLRARRRAIADGCPPTDVLAVVAPIHPRAITARGHQ